MQHLDAILAFALTLAALATVVTIIMEVGLRILRMRKRNLVELMKLFDRELMNGMFKLSPDERIAFFGSVVGNPAGAAVARPYGGTLCKLVTTVMGFVPNLVARARTLASGRTDPKSRPPDADTTAVIDSLSEFNWCRLGRDVYDKVSLEHVLRRLAENNLVKSGLQDTPAAAKAELDRLARKFEELSSAISADFKRRAQIWSIVLGVVLAVGANVDGLRVFDAYLDDNSLSQAIISQQAAFESEAAEAEERRKVLDELTREVDAALKAIQDAGGVGDDAQNAALAAALDALAVETSPNAIQDSAQRVATAFANLQSLGIPVGWSYYPACSVSDDVDGVSKAAGQQCSQIAERVAACKEAASSEGCESAFVNMIVKVPIVGGLANWFLRSLPEKWAYLGQIKATVWHDPAGFIRWLMLAIGTGLLIGLGAPFWFDVAKRLAEVRKMFDGKGSTEERNSGANANGNTGDRGSIVGDVIATAGPPSSSQQGQTAP